MLPKLDVTGSNPVARSDCSLLTTFRFCLQIRPAPCSVSATTVTPRASMAFSAQRRPPRPPARLDPLQAASWMERIRAGDEAAFERMFRLYYNPLCRYVVGYLGNRDSAEDAVQSVFARIWDDRSHWAVHDLEHYLYAAVRRAAMSHCRRAAVRRRAAPLLTLAYGGQAAVSWADAEFEARDLRHRLERAMATLTPCTR